MRLIALWIALSSALTVYAGDLVVLENDLVRLELDPRIFSVRFIGFPGGKNFLEPIYLPETEIAGSGWLEPGGITTDLLPEELDSVVLRRGPAEVIEHERDYVLLLGPKDPATQWRMKKEYRLTPGKPEILYKATALTSRKDEQRAGLRMTAQIPAGGTLAFSRAAGELGLLRGDFPEFAALRNGEEDQYMVHVPPAQALDQVLLGAPVSEVALTTESGRWTRQLHVPSAAIATDSASGERLLLLFDSASHVYQVGLEVYQAGINVGAPLVVEERWTLTAPEDEKTK